MARRALHLCVLWTFAVVAPLFDELGDHAEFFVVRGNTPGDILIVAFGLVLVPALVLSLVVELAVLARPPVGEWLHVVLVGVLFGIFAMDLLERLWGATVPLLIGAIALGAAGGWAYMRFAEARSFLTALSPAPVVFLLIFLAFSPVNELLSIGSGDERRSSLRSNTPVVLAIFDELPTISLMDARGRIDGRSFPNFARLARTSAWYRNATTVADGTQLAVPSIFSGRRPSSNLPTARRYPNNIFTLLGGRHELHVLEPITRVCGACEDQRPRIPASQRIDSLLSDLALVEGHLLLPRGLSGGLPPVDRNFEDFGGQEAGVTAPGARRGAAGRDDGRPQRSIAGDDLFADRLRDAERYVRRVRRPGQVPPAYVAHFIVPHVPWRLLPSGRQYPVGGPALPGSNDRVWSRDRFLVGQATQRHLLQVGYADRLLGRLIARLRASGLWDRALVVVTADHGISLRPGGSRREVKRADFAGIAGVPLFIKRPRQRVGRIDGGPARSIDIMPTIAAILDARDWPRFHGESLTAAGRAARPDEPLRVRQGRSRKPVSVSLGAFVGARQSELARQRRSFPFGLRSVFRVGPNRGLLGRRVRSLVVAQGPPAARVDGAGAYGQVNARSGVVPVYVSGQLTSVRQAGIALATAVNGRIVGVGRSYFVRDAMRFSMLVPPRSLAPGRNVVEIFAVLPGRLVRIGRAPS